MSTALKSQPPRPKCAARARHLGPQAKQAPIAATAGHHRCFMDDPRKRARRATGKPPLRPATSGRTSHYRQERFPPCPRLLDHRRAGASQRNADPGGHTHAGCGCCAETNGSRCDADQPDTAPAGPVGVPFAKSVVPVAPDHQHVHQGFAMPVITLADRRAGLGDYLTGRGTSPIWR